MPRSVAFSGRRQPRKDAEQGRFSGPVRATHTEQRTRLNQERKVREHGASAAFCCQLFNDQSHDTARTLNAAHADASAMMQER